MSNAGQTFNATELQYLTTVSVDGVGNIGVFDTVSGDGVDAKPVKHRPGGMGPEISYLALPVYSDVTVSRVYDEGRDHELIATLHNAVGILRATVSVQPLDNNANPFGSPRTYRGRVAAVKDGKVDSTSNNPRIWTLDVQVETIAN